MLNAKKKKFSMSSKEAKISDEQKSAALQQQYNKLQADISDLQEQSSAISGQIQEYLIVDKTLTSISPEKRQGRKCFKMIGGVLVEKNIDEVIKMLNNDINGLRDQKTKTETLLKNARSGLENWIKSNHIKIVRQ